MATKVITIQNILGGLRPSSQFSASGQYGPSLGIDPDMPITDSDTEPSGVIRPTSMSEFSSTILTSKPLWIKTNPKNTNVYVYLQNGLIVSYDTALASETSVGTPTSGAGNGMEYYRNYLWFATPTDISRYGPLNGSPAIINTSWSGSSYTGTSGGLGKAVLTNTTYPSVGGTVMPNHVMHHHIADGKLYIADVLSDSTANTNKGALHYVNLSKTTVEGDTNNNSSYNAIDFEHGYYPTCMASLQNSLVVGLIEGTDTITEQGRGIVSVWDATSAQPTVYVQKEFPDPLITAMINDNGIVYIFSGSAQGGCRITQYLGGYNFQEVAYLPYVLPPLQGAVDHKLGRVVFGTKTTKPSSQAVVYAIGSKFESLGRGIHPILTPLTSGTNPSVTALKYVQQVNPVLLQPIVGWGTDTANAASSGLNKSSTTYGTVSNVWRSELFRVGSSFQIKTIEIPLSTAIGANMTIVPKVYVDNDVASFTLTTINNTNYPGSDRKLVLQPQGVVGKHNFYLELTFSGSALIAPTLPIRITYEEQPQ